MSAKRTIMLEGTKISQEYITGEVFYKMRQTDIKPFNSIIKDVFFKSGSRNNWHIYAGLQMLIVTEGIGYYQERGTPIRLIRKGEVITIRAGVEHWHGASPNSLFSHIVIATDIDKGGVKWLERVTDEEYNSFIE